MRKRASRRSVVDYPIKTLSQLRPILQGFRKSAGLTQAAMASHLGVTQQTYAQLEANPAAVSVERLYRVLRVLQVDLKLTPASSGQSDSAAENDAPSAAVASTANEAGSDETPTRRRAKTPSPVTTATTGNAKRQPQAASKRSTAPVKQTRARSPAKPEKASASTATRKTRGSGSARSSSAGKKREDW
jgi:HTH-type transcriptional regulator / antitoxin HipB